MANTYTWRVPRLDSTPLVDGIAMLFNESAGGEVEVIEVRVTEPSETTSTATIFGAGIHDLMLISATSGGTPVAAVKPDTDTLDLPSEIEFSVSPMAVTEVTLLRRMADCPQFSVATTSAMRATRTHMRTGLADTASSGSIWHSFIRSGGADNTHIILREGQGLAFVQRSGIVPHSMTVNLLCTTPSNGSTYVFRSRDVGTMVAGRAVWSLINRTGSGEEIEVRLIQMSEDGEVGATAGIMLPASLRLVRTEGYIPSQEFVPVEGTSIAHDPSKASMPAGLKLLSGAFRAALPGQGQGASYTWDSSDHSVANIAKEWRSGIVRQIARSPRPNRNTDICTTPDNGFDIYKAKVGQGIILRKGEGLALLGGRAGVLDNSQFNYFDMRVTFVHRPAMTYPIVGNNRIVRVL